METQYDRTVQLIGSTGLARLQKAYVLVFGLGGVGSHCAEALARGGIGHLGLIDHDRVALPNLNRQAVALHSTLGRPKVEVMAQRIRDIDPAIQVEVWQRFALPGEMEPFFRRRPDYVIDAVDTVSAKIALAQLCTQRGIPLISCMGTGNKLHPEEFTITDLFSTRVCPLCRIMRRELKKRHIPALKVLYSPEPPIPPREAPKCLSPKGVPAPGSVSFVPPVAGLLLAGEVIRELLQEAP